MHYITIIILSLIKLFINTIIHNIPYEKVGNNEPVSIADEVPFDIPESWEWCRLKSLGAPVDDAFADGPFGSNLKKEHYTEEREVRLIQLSNIGDEGWKDTNTKYTTYMHAQTLSRSMVKPGCIVIAKMMPAGRAIIVPNLEKDYILSSDAVKFIPNERLDVEYLLFAINSPAFRNQVVAEAHGVTRVRTSLGKLQTYYLPIPPLMEQKKIVQQIKSIHPLIKKYESEESKRLELDSLFPDLLKKSILQEAVMGKLVPQDPNDELASVLLEKIRAEKQRLITEGKLKKDKHESVIYRRDNSHYEKLDGVEHCIDDEIPFEIPKSWCWMRLGSLIQIESGKGLTSKEMRPGNIPVYGGNGITGYHDTGFVTKETVVIGRVGFYCGSVHVTEPNSWVTDNAFIITYPEAYIYRAYLVHTLTYMNLGKNNNATAQPVVSGKKIYPMLIPIPPYEEQIRISKQLDNAILVCNNLFQ